MPPRTPVQTFARPAQVVVWAPVIAADRAFEAWEDSCKWAGRFGNFPPPKGADFAAIRRRMEAWDRIGAAFRAARS